MSTRGANGGPGSSPNHEPITSTIRRRTISGVSAPPLKRIASGRAGRSAGWWPSGAIASARCRRRKKLRCLGTAGSATNGRPNSCKPLLAARCGIFAARHRGEETVERDRLDLGSRQLRLDAAADQLRAPAGDRDRPALDGRLLLAQQLFLGRPAGESKCTPLLGVEPRAAELLLDMMGQREVDVVAAEHQVIADGDAAKPGAGRRLDDRDQAEVGRPAADVADQDQLAGANLALPAVLVRDDPAVKRRLRFLEQRDRGELRPLGGLDRQLAGRLVERGRHRQHDLLVFEAL